MTPLHLAAKNNENPAVIEALLAAGALIEAQDSDGWMLWQSAVLNSENPAVMKILLAAIVL